MLVALVNVVGVAAPTAPGTTILAPHQVPVDAAVADGRQAAKAPEEGAFWRWRRDLLSQHPRGPLARVLVVTPYFLVVRESYRRALHGRPMLGPEGREILRHAVQESGAAFPVTLVLVPAPGRELPAPGTVTLIDGSGHPVPLRRVDRRENGALLHLTYEFASADPRSLAIRLAGRPGYVYPFDLRGMD